MARSTTASKKNTGSGRRKRSQPKKATTTAAPSKPTEVRQDLFDSIVAEVEGLLVRKPELRWNAKKTYASLLVEGTNLAYLFAPTKKGVRVEPAASPADLPKAIKGFKKSGRSARFDTVAVIEDAPGVKHAAAAIKVAYEKANKETESRPNGQRLAEDTKEAAAEAAKS